MGRITNHVNLKMQFDELNGLKRLVFLNSFHEQRAVLSPFWPKIRLARPWIKSGIDLNREASKGVDGRDQPRQAKGKPGHESLASHARLLSSVVRGLEQGRALGRLIAHECDPHPVGRAGRA